MLAVSGKHYKKIYLTSIEAPQPYRDYGASDCKINYMFNNIINVRVSNYNTIFIETGNGKIMNKKGLLGCFINELSSRKSLSEFFGILDNIINGDYSIGIYETDGYEAELVDVDNNKMIKIFFRLTDNYESCFVSLGEFKNILKFYIEEKKEFDRDENLYIMKMITKGAHIIVASSNTHQDIVSNGIILVDNLVNKLKLLHKRYLRNN